MVQGRADLIAELTDANAKIKKWWECRDKGEFVERLIHVELADHACWIERFIHSDVLVNGFQVLICPFELQDRPFEGMRFTPAFQFHNEELS